MKRARLHDGRTLEFPDYMTDAEVDVNVKRFWTKEQKKKQDEAAAKDTQAKAEEAKRNEAQRQQAEKDRKRGEAETAQRAATQKARETDLGLALKKNESLSGIYGNLGIIAEGMKSFASVEKKLDATVKAVLLLNKTIVDSSMMISETLRMPKQIVKNERGAITGIQVAGDELDKKVH